MENSKSQVTHNIALLFFSFLALIFGIYLYGARAIPTFTGWMMHGDLATYYLSWLFLRVEPWTFPFGQISGYVHPQLTSIVFSDAVPIIAIFLKIFKNIFPDSIQYHGMVVLLNFFLQGFFSILLLRRFTGSISIQYLAGCLLVLMPTFIIRNNGHIPIGFHWVILASLFLYFYKSNVLTNKLILSWTLLLMLAIGINFYIFTMSLAIYFAYLLRILMHDYKSNAIPVIGWSLIIVICIYIMMYAMGYFVVSSEQAQSYQYGIYSFNPLSYFLPIMNGGHDFFPSRFLPSFVSPNNGQYEGYNFPGTGNLFLLFVAVLICGAWYKKLVFMNYFPLLLLCLAILIVSMSHLVIIGNQVLFEVKLPSWLFAKLSIFRSSGRFFWIVVYLLVLFSVAVIIKKLTLNKSITILIIAVALQIVDISPNLQAIHNYYSENTERFNWKSPLVSSDWSTLFDDYDHIAFIPAKHSGDDYVPFAYYAVQNNMTFNAGYLARENRSAREMQAKEFLSGNFQDNTIYIYREKNLPPKLANDDSILKGYLDNYLIVAPGFNNVEVLRDFKRI